MRSEKDRGEKIHLVLRYGVRHVPLDQRPCTDLIYRTPNCPLGPHGDTVTCYVGREVPPPQGTPQPGNVVWPVPRPSLGVPGRSPRPSEILSRNPRLGSQRVGNSGLAVQESWSRTACPEPRVRIPNFGTPGSEPGTQSHDTVLKTVLDEWLEWKHGTGMHYMNRDVQA